MRQYEERHPLLQALSRDLESETVEALRGLHHIDRIYYRVKEAGSFAEKARDPGTEPPYTDPLIEVEDQVAGRVLVFFRRDIDRVVERLAATFTTVEQEHKARPRDEEFGYESRHLIYVIPPHLRPAGWSARADLPETFELQVRTLMMHAYAEPQHDLAYKAALELPSRIRRELAWIAASAWGADAAYERVCDWAAANGPDAA